MNRGSPVRRALIALAVALAASAPEATAVTGHPALECRLTLPATARVGAPVPLQFGLINRGKSRLHVLTWNTPLEGWFGRFLRVTQGGREIPYQGPQVKRGAPVADDYLVLAAGRNAEATLDLTQAYDLTEPGHYQVAFDGWLPDVTARVPSPGRQTPWTPACPAASVEITAGP